MDVGLCQNENVGHLYNVQESSWAACGVHSSVQETTLCAIRTIDQANKKKNICWNQETEANAYIAVSMISMITMSLMELHFFDDQFTISDGEPHHILP